MRILLEGCSYKIELLEKIFDDSRYFNQSGDNGIITNVGYHHSFSNNQLVFMLPKVFINEGLVFGKYKPVDLAKEDFAKSMKNDNELKWARQLLVYFYKSLSEFRKRHQNNNIVEKSQTFELNTNIGMKEYSYLDLLLSFINFYKKNKNVILFRQIEQISNKIKKPNWEKTVRKSLPILTEENAPIYIEIRDKKKILDSEEELLTYFFSIVNNFNKEHALGFKIEKIYNFIEGSKFENLKKNGLKKLRKIKYRYFSDTLKKMYKLCEMYFSINDKSRPRAMKDDFITVRNYNIVFEDMIDKIFSDELDINKASGEYSLFDLKHNKDGKIIDHIYEDRSLIDDSNIFYIGDSKYYKTDSFAGKLSTFKQFTYSKNVIQYNIDLFNSTGKYYSSKMRYRDELTEGYDITPNFFIYGFVDDLNNFSSSNLKSTDSPKPSFHFKGRLFDRDTMFVQQYKINFLFVLRFYTSQNSQEIYEFRKKTKESFRKKFIDFFNSSDKSGVIFYKKKFLGDDLKGFVDSNFKKLNGKCFSTKDLTLIIAKHNDDNSLDKLISENEFESLKLF